MKLHDLKPTRGPRKALRWSWTPLVSKTAGRAPKARRTHGRRQRPYFEGGQLPMVRRSLQAGVYQHLPHQYQEVNVDCSKRVSGRARSRLRRW
jgi:ribosomal protein L15